MVTNGCGEEGDLFIDVICDGHSIRPPERIYELLGLQDKTYKPFTIIFFQEKRNKNLGCIL